MLREVGVNIITDEMQRFIEKIDELKKVFWNAYIVTGGTNVFVTVKKEDKEKVKNAAMEFKCEPVDLKVAGKPDVISKNFGELLSIYYSSFCREIELNQLLLL